jgi:hypothetical protein
MAIGQICLFLLILLVFFVRYGFKTILVGMLAWAIVMLLFKWW